MNFTADQISHLVNGTVVGDGSVTVNTFAKIEEGHAGALSFLANPKYTHCIYSTKSSIVLVRRDFEPEYPVSATLIKVDDPYQTLTGLLTMVNDMMSPKPVGIEQPSYIAPGVELPEDVYVGAFAYIAAGAVIGRGAKIYPHTYVGADAVIGEDTVIYPGAKIYHRCRIGARCILHAGVVIGADGFGFAPDANGVYTKIPQMGIVEIADDVEIGANTTVDRATMGSTRIGQGTKLDNLIMVAHNVEIGEHNVFASQTGSAGSTKIGSHCQIGGQSGFAGHIHVGDHVMVGAQSGIPGNLPDDSKVMGYPCVPVKEFYRNSAYVRRLGELFAKINKLEGGIAAGCSGNEK